MVVAGARGGRVRDDRHVLGVLAPISVHQLRDRPAYDPVACSESLIDRGGAGYVAAMLLPAVLSAVPVIVPRRSVAWATVGTLVVAAVVAFVMVGGVAMMLVATAVPATVLAGFHRHLAERGTTTSVSAQSFLERVHQQQRGE